VSAVGTLR